MSPTELAQSRMRAVEALEQIATYARAGSQVDALLSREATLRAILDDISLYAERVAKETGANGNG